MPNSISVNRVAFTVRDTTAASEVPPHAWAILTPPDCHVERAGRCRLTRVVTPPPQGQKCHVDGDRTDVCVRPRLSRRLEDQRGLPCSRWFGMIGLA
jgi:hypothetical protein